MENATNQKLAELKEQQERELKDFQSKLSQIVEELKKLPQTNTSIANNVQKIVNQGVILKNVTAKKALG
jgi:DNA polymerase/3'-5' exonuclease PolX